MSTQLPKVRVFGYVFAESGVGQHNRLLIESVKKAGAPYSVTPYTETETRQESRFDDLGEKLEAWDVNLVGVNADELPGFVSRFQGELEKASYTVGLWAWELDKFPGWMARSAEFVDEVWANSNFSAKAISRAVNRPVHGFPLPVSRPQPAPLGRADLGLPEDDYLFLFCFDFDSIFDRKNPLAVIEAFRLAFPREGDAQLVIKSINAGRHRQLDERLVEAASGRSDITVLERFVTLEEHHAIVAACDAYVSLHRAEGFGLTLAEAMALGKPVLGTAYSGNLDFMTTENSYLVPYRMVPIPPGCEPYLAGWQWAEPDIEAAAALMRHVHEHPESARKRGEVAEDDIERLHSPTARAHFVRRRLLEIQELLHRGKSVPRLEVKPPEPVEPELPTGAKVKALVQEQTTALDHAASLVEAGPDIGMGSRFPRAALRLRRLVLRLLRNYDVHQRRVGEALVNAIGSSGARIEDLDGRMARMERRVEVAASDLARKGALLEDMARRLDGQVTTLRGRVEGLAGGLETLLHHVSTSNSDAADGSGHGVRETWPLEGAVGEIWPLGIYDLKRWLAALTEELTAIPYLSDPAMLKDPHTAAGQGLAFQNPNAEAASDIYRCFEDLFRGSEAFIRERQRQYLDLLNGRSPVLDLGCGRGEMLDLLAEAGIEAMGVDLDEGMVEHCRAKGHRVEQADGIERLRDHPDGSLGALFTSQVIEHLGFEKLLDLLTLARRKLHPGGILIAETVNPHSLRAFKAFWVDPTHRAPLFPEVVLALSRFVGFESGYILFPNGKGDWERDRRTEGEYALVARKSIASLQPAA